MSWTVYRGGVEREGRESSDSTRLVRWGTDSCKAAQETAAKQVCKSRKYRQKKSTLKYQSHFFEVRSLPIRSNFKQTSPGSTHFKLTLQQRWVRPGLVA